MKFALDIGVTVLSTDRGPYLVNHAPIITAQILARGLKLKIPVVIVINENMNIRMHQIPPDKIIFLPGGRFIDLGRHISATHGGTMIT
jgi:hypothetical protein